MSDARRPPTRSDPARLPPPVPRRFRLEPRPWVTRSVAGRVLVVVLLVVALLTMLSYAVVLGGALAIDRPGDHPWWVYLVGVVVFGGLTVTYAGATPNVWWPGRRGRASFGTGRGGVRDRARPG